MNKHHTTARATAFIALIAAATASYAVDFNNVGSSGPLTQGWSFETGPSSINFSTPNAIVGDFQVLRSGTLDLIYDAARGAGPSMMSIDVSIALVDPCTGSGTIAFLEEVVELDSGDNEIGQIGSISQNFDLNSSTVWSATIDFSHAVERFRAKLGFQLDATADTAVLDKARVALTGQTVNVVPEPATLGTLGMGVLALARRRRARN